MFHSKKLIDADTAHKNTADDSQAAQSDHAPLPEHAHLWPSHVAAKPVEPSGPAGGPDAHSDAAVTEELETGRQSSQPQEVAPAREQSAPEQRQEIDNRVKDHAQAILLHAGMVHEVSEDTAAKLWDEFYAARTSEDFAARLNKIDVPNALKSELYLAHKQYRNVEPSRLDRAVEAVKRVAQLHATPTTGGKSVVTVAEAHPHVLQALTDASKREE